MIRFTFIVTFFAYLLGAVYSLNAPGAEPPGNQRSERAITDTKPVLEKALKQKNLALGSKIYLRIFKQPGVLELWIKNNNAHYTLFKTYEICTFSGMLGPKVKEGDLQSPEGFYWVAANQMNPWSRFHLSFNLGFPNAYDRYHGRTGSALMVHGNCVSIGCYAMTDEYINEIYTLADAALRNGQSFFRVHIFPFYMNPKNMEEHASNPWIDFWRNLKEGYDMFNQSRLPPEVTVKNGRYIFSVDNR